jgi:pimeloyl-ACP methyl ester carboxylesterase
MRSRRSLLQLIFAAAAQRLLADIPGAAARPFRVAVPKQTLDRILTRVREARWPDRLDGTWQYGANYDYLKELAAYWTTRYNWRKAEERLNSFPQFIARVEDFDIHFFHVKGKGPRPAPIVITHGWPGSVVEFLDAIGPLTDPARFGGSPDDAFDVVIPSLPGFGFSSKPKGKPVGPVTVARLWHKLMTEVAGYSRYGAQGGDWGSRVTTQLAVQFPNDLIGIYLSGGAARPAPEAQQTDEERAYLRAAAAFRTAEMDYFNEQQHKPETVSFVLADSPLGAAAWIIEKFKGWSDSGDNIESVFTKDQLLTNLMVYLVTDTVGTGVWIYRGNADEPSPQQGRIMVPTGFAAFPKELAGLAPPRSMIERDFNLVHYTRMPRGGHFGCFEQPQLFVEDLRTFFRKVLG